MSEEERNKEAVRDDLADMTRTTSETARYLSFGLLAVYYSLRTAEADTTAGTIYSQFVCLLSIVAFCGVAALLCDVLQYLFGAKSAHEAHARESGRYSSKSFSYQARGNLFTAKQWFAGIGAILLVAVFALA